MVGALRKAVVGVTLSVLAWAAVPQLAQATTAPTAGPGGHLLRRHGHRRAPTLELTAHVTEVDLSRLDESDPGTSAGGPGSEFLNLSMTTDDSADGTELQRLRRRPGQRYRVGSARWSGRYTSRRPDRTSASSRALTPSWSRPRLPRARSRSRPGR